jgi:hypothetical protein
MIGHLAEKFMSSNIPRFRPGLTVFFTAFVVMTVASAWATPTVDVDTPSTTTAGATFTLPRTWSISTAATAAIANPPEADTHIAIVDVGNATDAKNAAAKGWAVYRPDAHRTLKLVTPLSPKDGWEERQTIRMKRPSSR